MTGVAKLVVIGGQSIRGWSQHDDMRCDQRIAFRWILEMPRVVAARAAKRHRKNSGDPLVIGTLLHAAAAQWSAIEQARQQVQIAEAEALAGGNPAAIGVAESWAAKRDSYASVEEAIASVSLEIADAEATPETELAYAMFLSFLSHTAARTGRILGVEQPIEAWFDAKGRWVPAPPDAAERRAMAVADPLKLCTLGPPYLLTTRIDRLRIDGSSSYACDPETGRSGLVIIDDYKTMWHLDSGKRDGFTASGQILLLREWGARKFGSRFGGVVLWAVKKIPPYDVEPVKPEPAPHAQSCLGEAVVDRNERLARLVASGRDPWRYPKQLSEQGPCSDRYARCVYFDFCMNGPAALKDGEM